MYTDDYRCINVSKSRRFLCSTDSKHDATCETCFANWELDYNIINRQIISFGDSDLPNFGRHIEKYCAQSQEKYYEIEKRLISILQLKNYHGVFNQFPEVIQKEVTKWLKKVSKLRPTDDQNFYKLACCPANSLEARSRKGAIWNECLKCRGTKYYISCAHEEIHKDVCEECWIWENFHKCDIPIALASRLWSWKNKLSSKWKIESAKYFCWFFLRGNPHLISMAANLLQTEIGDFKCTINILIDLVYTFLDRMKKDERKVIEYLRGEELAWVPDRGCFPKKLSQPCSEDKCKTIKRFLKLLYEVHCSSNITKGRCSRAINILF